MNKSLFLLAGMTVTASLTFGSLTVEACGYPKKNQPPQCQPATQTPVPTPVPPTPVPPTPVPPTPVPTTPPTLPAVPPPAPQVLIVPAVTPVPVAATPVPVLPPPAQASVPESGGGPRLSEYCHYEPSTGNWEIRRSTDADRMIRQGGELPIAPHVCDQHEVVWTPTPTVTSPSTEWTTETELSPSPTPDVPLITPPSLSQEEVCTSCATTVEPTSDAGEPEVPQPCEVPVQIPEWSCLAPAEE